MRMRIRTMYWAGLLGLFLAACSQPQGQVSPQVAVGPAVTVTKTAVPSFKRTYRWTVEKTALEQSLTLAVGQIYTLKYQVKLTAKAEDSDWQVSGTVTIQNTGTGAVVLQAPTDVLSTGESVALHCGGVSFPYTLAEGASLNCTYQQPLSSGASRTNTAQVAWGTDGTSFPNTASGQAAFSFTTPTEVVDDQVRVQDSYAGDLGTVQAGQSPKVFSYSREIQYLRVLLDLPLLIVAKGGVPWDPTVSTPFTILTQKPPWSPYTSG